jgi:uncharacterized protein
MISSAPLMPHQPLIDGFEFATAGATQQGVSPLESFPRLRDMLASDAGEIAWTLQGVRDERGRPSLRVSVGGRVLLRCQRCLEAMPFEVQAEAILVLAATQAEIDADPVDVQAPDRVLAAKEMPVRDLIEDELVLALPYAPRHESCAARPARSAGANVSPFAGLRGLMRSKH